MSYACEKCGNPRETADKDGVLVIEPCQACPAEEPKEQRTCEACGGIGNPQDFVHRKLDELTAEMRIVRCVLEQHIPYDIRLRINELDKDLHEQYARWAAVMGICIDHKIGK